MDYENIFRIYFLNVLNFNKIFLKILSFHSIQNPTQDFNLEKRFQPVILFFSFFVAKIPPFCYEKKFQKQQHGQGNFLESFQKNSPHIWREELFVDSL
jgi:hypothetical protein